MTHLGRDNETVHHRRALSSAIGPTEQPRFSAQGDTAQPSSRRIVGEADAAIFKEQPEGRWPHHPAELEAVPLQESNQVVGRLPLEFGCATTAIRSKPDTILH